MTFGLIIPTLNASSWLPDLLPAIAHQTIKPDRFLVVDSSSDDGTAEAFRSAGADLLIISRAEFDHGRTRQQALEHLGDLDVVIYLTQDAIPESPSSFAALLAAFDDPHVAIAYGRQLPRQDASAIEAHARLFNYPDRAAIDSEATLASRGVRATFCSNSFAAYRVSALREIGGFPTHCIFGEDAIAATRLMLAGWSKRYVPGAWVRHSHRYSIKQDFQRYFDVGVMHSDYAALWRQVGMPSGEGFRFVRSELAYLLKHEPSAIPSALARTAVKLIGYNLGALYRRLPSGPRQAMSMNKGYWRRRAAPAAQLSNAGG
jgi:rhamnosyltransferase